MVHQPSGGAQGQASDIAIAAQEILKMRDLLNGLYVRHTGQAKERVGERAGAVGERQRAALDAPARGAAPAQIGLKGLPGALFLLKSCSGGAGARLLHVGHRGARVWCAGIWRWRRRLPSRWLAAPARPASHLNLNLKFSVPLAAHAAVCAANPAAGIVDEVIEQRPPPPEEPGRLPAGGGGASVF